MTHHQTCLCVECAPLPGAIDPIRLHSPTYREERARAWAKAVRLPTDAVQGFVEDQETRWLLEQAQRRRDAEAA